VLFASALVLAACTPGDRTPARRAPALHIGPTVDRIAGVPVRFEEYRSNNNKPIRDGWRARKASDVAEDGTVITAPGYSLEGWIRARVPGTVLTTLIENGTYQDPYFGLNNTRIPDISDAGPEFYTYWFLKDVNLTSADPGRRVWLKFRGINYFADVFLNGARVNRDTHRGMFLRQRYDVTDLVRFDGSNRLAILVRPPDPPGVPGGQGGDGVIGRNVTMQFTPGWDWVMPVPDRNTGIWDEVSLSYTGPVVIEDPHVVTKVPGARLPREGQEPAFVSISARLRNVTSRPVTGSVAYRLGGIEQRRPLILGPGESATAIFEEIKVSNPRLWWPNGYGQQPLYDLVLLFHEEGQGVSDLRHMNVGIREITSAMDPSTGGRIFRINGQKIFIRGGNWIASDALLRLDPLRYDHEVRMHAEMNLNAIRVWGGSITERPEFFNACDKYGLLVMQDLWITGDANGAWFDRRKKESQERRRAYPDDHSLFLASAADQIKMLRNHASLFLYSGGNEWPPPADIDVALRSELLPELDGTRPYITHSTSDSLSVNIIGGNGDGPYRIQPPEIFFSRRSFPFNSEVGSVGIPVAETMRQIMHERDLVLPIGRDVNEVWRYHKYSGFTDSEGTNHIDLYGAPSTIEQYTEQAQIASYVQYKALIEGWNAHMWDWYTGVLLWKTQNPWTGLRGQMYDWFLDQTGGFYGIRTAAEPIHVQLNLATRQVDVVNTSTQSLADVEIRATAYSLSGRRFDAGHVRADVPAERTTGVFELDVPEDVGDVYFVRLEAASAEGKVVSANTYWLRRGDADFAGLRDLAPARIEASASELPRSAEEGLRLALRVANPDSVVAFWIRLQLLLPETRQRVLPTFYEDNYFTLMPGEERSIRIEIPSGVPESAGRPELWLEGWNVARSRVDVPLSMPGAG
jgi:hypothetical protein